MSGSRRTPGHVAITGAAGAIGSALARAMRAAWPDAELALVDRDEPTGVAAEVGGTAYACDLANLDGLPGIVSRIEENGPIDGLVNCAGVMRVRDVAAWRWEDARELVMIDLLAPLRLQDLVVRGMVERGHGVIVNVASMAGRVPLKGCAFYGAAKAGLSMASEIAHAELRRRGVHVVTVYPGPVSSELERAARAQYKEDPFARVAPLGKAEPLARRVLDAIVNRKPRVIYPPWYEIGFRAPGLASRFSLEFGPDPLS